MHAGSKYTPPGAARVAVIRHPLTNALALCCYPTETSDSLFDPNQNSLIYGEYCRHCNLLRTGSLNEILLSGAPVVHGLSIRASLNEKSGESSNVCPIGIRQTVGQWRHGIFCP